MKYCNFHKLKYLFKESGLFVELNGKLYFSELSMPLNINNEISNLENAFIWDIASDVYVIYKTNVYKYSINNIKYLNGKFIVLVSDNYYSLTSEGTVGDQITRDEWSHGYSIKSLKVCIVNNRIEYYMCKTNMHEVYQNGRKKIGFEF